MCFRSWYEEYKISREKCETLKKKLKLSMRKICIIEESLTCIKNYTEALIQLKNV